MGGVLCCLSKPIDFDGEVTLYHFHLHRAIGKGAFGKVRVVEHKRSKKLYALKYINKACCMRQKAVSNILQERRFLEEIDHPFLVNLRYAFQDDDNCFFVLDLMLGGDLRYHLERTGHVSEEIVRFWIAELACALEYLQRRRIVHRDVKPDNILMDDKGHVHLTDFNIAIHYSERRKHTSIAGSAAYMAPEMVGKLGYSWQVDWWSLGVTAYELLFGRRPFQGRSSEKMDNSILREIITFPENASSRCSPEGISALRGFLDRDPHTRLGCRPHGQGFKDVQAHPWFASINWEQLQNKECNPPFVPDTKHANFDVTHELEEFLLVERPLTHSRRRGNPDFEKMKPELRLLEEQFTVYDCTRLKRMSYYPYNQPVIAGAHSSCASSTSGTLVPTATIAERSLTSSPTSFNHPAHASE